jgi:hypothetical protein
MYSDATTSTAAIREQFGIQDTTLYRLLQRRGVAPRRSGATLGGQPRTRASSKTVRAGRAAATTNGVGTSFSVNFRAVSVVSGRSALDVVLELERLGATDIEEIRRQ